MYISSASRVLSRAVAEKKQFAKNKMVNSNIAFVSKHNPKTSISSDLREQTKQTDEGEHGKQYLRF